MSLKKSNICIFSLNLEKFTPDRKFLHRHVCGVCDKYEVWTENRQEGEHACWLLSRIEKGAANCMMDKVNGFQSI